jgi:hypothetical protein
VKRIVGLQRNDVPHSTPAMDGVVLYIVLIASVCYHHPYGVIHLHALLGLSPHVL